MNLSVFATGYLGTAAIDTPHLGDCELLRFSDYQYMDALPETLLLGSLGSASADIPLASLLKQSVTTSVSLDEAFSAGCVWLVQPVSLQLQRDSFSLLEVSQLTVEEYQAMTSLLNTHFSFDGIRFHTTPTGRYWLMQLPAPIQANAPLVQLAMQRNVQHFQPEGPDGYVIRQMMNQVQMLLHEHPINQKRMVLGQFPVNSVWCSGNGILPATLHHAYDAIYGDGEFFQGILRKINLTAQTDLQALFNTDASSALVVVDQFEDVDWRLCMKATQNWKVKQLNVYMPLANGTLKLSLTPLKSWRWWRRMNHLQRIEQAMKCALN